MNFVITNKIEVEIMKSKYCKICGEEFIPTHTANTICPNDHAVNCPVCGKIMIWNSTRPVEPCSKECKKEYTKQKNIAKWGVEHPMQNKAVQADYRQTMLDKYGVASPMQSAEIKAKAVKTNKEKFGTDWVLGNEEIKRKSQATMIKKYGAKTTLESAMLRKKVEETCLEKYGISDSKRSAGNAIKLSNSTFLHYQRDLSPDCEIHSMNDAFIARLRNAGIISLFDRQYGIITPSAQAVIEIDPSYTNNSIGNHWNTEGKDQNYHLGRTKKVNSKLGYHCIHVFDWDDWDDIIEIVDVKKKIYAKECTLYKLNQDIAEEFVDANHIEGAIKGQVLCLGLAKDKELLQVMTFGTPRFNSDYSTEMLRLCTKRGMAVVGGAEKLFKFATGYFGIADVVAYCDLSKFRGEVYRRLGMKLETILPPQEMWSRGNRKIASNMLRKYGFDNLFGTDYGKEASTVDLMLQDGWLPVYDCGQAVYTYSS